MKRMSRLESNKQVRRVLNQHGVDLAFCQYSCTGMEVRLTGWLARYDGSNFNAQQVEGLVYDIQRHLSGFTIVGDMDNWSFTTDHITFLGEKSGSNQAYSFEDEDDYESEVA